MLLPKKSAKLTAAILSLIFIASSSISSYASSPRTLANSSVGNSELSFDKKRDDDDDRRGRRRFDDDDRRRAGRFIWLNRFDRRDRDRDRDRDGCDWNKKDKKRKKDRRDRDDDDDDRRDRRRR